MPTGEGINATALNQGRHLTGDGIRIPAAVDIHQFNLPAADP